MKKRVLVLVLVGLAVFSMMVTKAALTSSGKISPDEISGFGVDSSNNLYIGKTHCIEVYAEGELIREIVPLTSRSYCFVVNEDDTITIGRATDGKALSTDLFGENVVELDGTDADIRRIMRKNKVIERNGSVYQWKNTWLGLRPYSILCDGEAIYSMPSWDYFFGLPYLLLLWVLILVGFILFIPFIPAAIEMKRFRSHK